MCASHDAMQAWFKHLQAAIDSCHTWLPATAGALPAAMKHADASTVVTGHHMSQPAAAAASGQAESAEGGGGHAPRGASLGGAPGSSSCTQPTAIPTAARALARRTTLPPPMAFQSPVSHELRDAAAHAQTKAAKPGGAAITTSYGQGVVVLGLTE